MKTLGILVSLLITGIAAAWYVPTMIWGYQITKESQTLDQDEDGKTAELQKGPAPVRWFRNRKELKGYFSLEDLTRYRSVSFTLNMPFEDILAPGEEAPEEIYRELYAMARAPSRLIAMCPEILGVVASKCDVGDSDGDVKRDGTVRLSGDLDYIPAYDIGDPSTVKNGEVVMVYATVAGRGELENTPEARKLVYQRTVSLCGALRERFGNCVISHLALTPSINRDSDTLAVSSDFAIYADKTVYRQKSVQAELDRMAEDLLN